MNSLYSKDDSDLSLSINPIEETSETEFDVSSE